MEISRRTIRLTAAGLIVFGAFLLVEHVYVYGTDPEDLIGHDWAGLAIILFGCIVGMFGREGKV